MEYVEGFELEDEVDAVGVVAAGRESGGFDISDVCRVCDGRGVAESERGERGRFSSIEGSTERSLDSALRCGSVFRRLGAGFEEGGEDDGGEAGGEAVAHSADSTG